MGYKALKKVFIVTSIVALLVVSTGSFALGSEAGRVQAQTGNIDPAAMVVDVAVARPVGFAALVTGAAFFAVSLPFSLLGGNTDMAFERMVADSAKYTFVRPLGGF